MTSPLPLPDWVPWWVHLAVLLAGGLFVLLYLAVPFAVALNRLQRRLSLQGTGA